MEESIDKVPPESNRPLKSAGVIFQFYLLVINLSDIRFLFTVSTNCKLELQEMK